MLDQTWYGGPGEPEVRNNLSLDIGVFGVFIAALVAGLITTTIWGPGLRRVSAAKTWPSVMGNVVASGVYPHRENDPLADAIADIAYSVNGLDFESFAEEAALDIPTSTTRPALNSAVEVWYDPSSPGRCTLIRTWQPAHTRRLWYILSPWIVVVSLTPVLVYRLRRAMRGELLGTD